MKHLFKVELEVAMKCFEFQGSQLHHTKARRVLVEAIGSALRLKTNQGREDSGLTGWEIKHIEQLT